MDTVYIVEFLVIYAKMFGIWESYAKKNWRAENCIAGPAGCTDVKLHCRVVPSLQPRARCYLTARRFLLKLFSLNTDMRRTVLQDHVVVPTSSCAVASCRRTSSGHENYHFPWIHPEFTFCCVYDWFSVNHVDVTKRVNTSQAVGQVVCFLAGGVVQWAIKTFNCNIL